MTVDASTHLLAVPGYAAQAQELGTDLVRLRRAIHREPELGLANPNTQRLVLESLDGLGLEITTGRALTSVVAVLRGGRPGPAVILRGDMDALPIEEETGLDYAATNGAMHACGHDLHTAGLVGAARLLAAHREDLPGSVIFMFQPGEEGHGGARIMLDEGLLDAAGVEPVAAYAIHVAPGPRGVFATRTGTVCAGSAELTIVVRGRGGHGSQPHQTVDPVPVAAEIVLALQTVATRQFDAFDPVIISVTRIETSTEATNVIPETATLRATVRALSPAAVTRLHEVVPRLAEGIAGAHGAAAAVTLDFHFPPTVNDAETTTTAISELRTAFGADRVLTVPTPMMGSEDFAFVLDRVPGTFLGLHASPGDIDPATAEFNHSPRVVFDDAVLPDQAAALAVLAHSRLQQAGREATR
ncbi:MAG: amidohydrolase [Nocardia sp.]|nr:amidohydrolase [Nocardia sp.]